MPNYNKCFIYKICCKDATITDCYIGSTTNIIRRRSQHKSSCTCIGNSKYNYLVYTFLREHGGWENFDLIALGEFSCESKMQQYKKERDWIEDLKPTLNKVVPANYQTGDVYDVKEYKATYRKENIDKVKQAGKEYYENNKEKCNAQNKEWKENNVEREKELKSAWYQKNKDRIKEENQKYFHCPCCNESIKLSNKSQHNRSKKHISNSSSQSDTPTISDSDSN